MSDFDTDSSDPNGGSDNTASTDGATGTFTNYDTGATGHTSAGQDSGAGADGDPSDPTNALDSAASTGDAIHKCQVCSISSQTTAASPANLARLRLAIGEQATLTIDNGPATWSLVSGGGSLSFATGTTVIYTAGDSAGSATIGADGPGNSSCTITFTVVEPASLSIVQADGTGLRHTKGKPSCGFLGQPYVHPDDVNFNCIQVREMNSKGTGDGYFKPLANQPHQPAGQDHTEWLIVRDCVEGQGSPVVCKDEIYSGYTRLPVQAGSRVFPIQWQYQIEGGDAKNFPAFQQTHVCDASGSCTTSKGGESKTCNLKDDATGW